MKLEEFLRLLRGVSQKSGYYMAKCPAHDDKKASLSITKGDDGKILLHCHAGCPTESICESLGLTMKDLFDEPVKAQEAAQIVATYDYTDLSGDLLLAQKLRKSDKTFAWRRPDGRGGWEYNRKGLNLLPYNAANIGGSKAVYLVEGEKDVNTLKRIGKAAVSLPDGAGSKWKDSYAEVFKGKHVAIIEDNDEPGRKFAEMAAGKLHGNAASVRILDLTRILADLPEHGDTTDLIMRMGDTEGIEAIARLARGTKEWKPDATNIESFRDCPISMAAVQAALATLGIKVRYNVLLKENEITGMPKEYSEENAENTLPVYLMDYMKSFGIKGVRRESIVDYLGCIADMERFNPAEEYFKSDKWDGKDRFPEIYRILNVTNAKHQNYIKKWLIQCVALALNEEETPIGAEGVLVFQGKQGLAKTSFFRILTPFQRWFVEGAVIDMSNKDSILKAISGWITELGELDSTLKREQSALKAFITATEDRVRHPYARKPARTPRRTSFCGTVNEKDYLRDETGSRRFWTIPIETIDKQALFSISSEWVLQLWLQVYQLYLTDKNGFRLTDEEMQQLQIDNKDFDIPLPFEEEVRSMLNYDLPIEKWEWWRAVDLARQTPGNPTARQVGRVLSKVVKELEAQYVEPNHNITKHNPLEKSPKNVKHYFLPIVRMGKYRVS